MKWEVDVQENSNLKKLQMPDWEVILTKSINFEYTDDFSNVHSGLQFSLVFQRIKSNRILHTYIPSIMVLIFCVEFRELSHLTRDLSQAEKKINVVTS